MANILTITLSLSRSTKGTHVYAEDVTGSGISSLYISKSALPNPPPKSIGVVVRDLSTPQFDVDKL